MPGAGVIRTHPYIPKHAASLLTFYPSRSEFAWNHVDVQLLFTFQSVVVMNQSYQQFRSIDRTDGDEKEKAREHRPSAPNTDTDTSTGYATVSPDVSCR